MWQVLLGSKKYSECDSGSKLAYIKIIIGHYCIAKRIGDTIICRNRNRLMNLYAQTVCSQAFYILCR